MTQIQAASIAALPKQASLETRTPSALAAADPGQIALPTSDKLEKSIETGDRDAQEHYQRPAQPSPADEESQSTPPSDAELNSIWSLSVTDDQPPPDLDIRG